MRRHKLETSIKVRMKEIVCKYAADSSSAVPNLKVGVDSLSNTSRLSEVFDKMDTVQSSYSEYLDERYAFPWLQAPAAMYMRYALLWDTTQRWVVVLCRRFGTTYRSYLQGSRSSWTSWPLKIVPIGCSETSIQNYHSTLRNIPEGRRARYVYHSLLSGFFQ
jgi:hypothetical protein